MIFAHNLLFFVLSCSVGISFSAPNKQALRKILITENPDTESNREKIRQLIENAYSRRPPTRKMGRMALNSTRKESRVDLGPRNNDTHHRKLQKINEEIAEYTFETDIMLNEEQAKTIAKKIEQGEARLKRQAINTPSLFWDTNSPIYYQFDSKLTPTNIANVRKAIQFWNDNSCLSFKEDSNARSRLYLTSAGGCWSYVGKQAASAYQIVSVGPMCDGLGTASHELAHAIGFWHQQSRYDRDNYVTVDFSNISPGQEHNFQKMTEQQAPTLDLPYDYGSVMQYWPYSFAIDNSKYTVYSKDMVNQNSLGQRESAAFSDVKMVNKLYNCTSKCSAKLNCGNCGFMDPRKCSQCKCPRYFGGATCSDLAKGSDSNCNGQVLQATSTWTKFNGIAGDPNNYNTSPTGTDCYWHVKAPEGSKIELRLTKALGPSLCMEQCPYQSVEINMGKFDIYGMIMCCPTYVNRVFTSEANLVAIRGLIRYNQVNFEVEFRSVPNNQPNTYQCSM